MNTCSLPRRGIDVMIRSALVAFTATAAVAGIVGCGPVAADATYREHNETSQYTTDITYPLGYPDAASATATPTTSTRRPTSRRNHPPRAWC